MDNTKLEAALSVGSIGHGTECVETALEYLSEMQKRQDELIAEIRQLALAGATKTQRKLARRKRLDGTTAELHKAAIVARGTEKMMNFIQRGVGI